MNSLMNNRGNGLGVPLSVGIGGITSLVGGTLIGIISLSIVGEGPEVLFAMISGPVIAVISILIFRAVKK